MLSIAAVSLYICAVETKAGVVNNADVVISGTIYRTFVDQSTGRTWLDIDNFCDAANTYNSIAATLVGSGFHLATTAELQELQLLSQRFRQIF